MSMKTFDVNEYEKLLKFGFAKNCRKWTSFVFECCHIVIVHVDFKKNWPFSTEDAMCLGMICSISKQVWNPFEFGWWKVETVF